MSTLNFLTYIWGCSTTVTSEGEVSSSVSNAVPTQSNSESQNIAVGVAPAEDEGLDLANCRNVVVDFEISGSGAVRPTQAVDCSAPKKVTVVPSVQQQFNQVVNGNATSNSNANLPARSRDLYEISPLE